MLERFLELKALYNAKELTVETLEVIQDSGIVSFENRGISRSKKDCMLCIIRYAGHDQSDATFKVFLRLHA